MLMYRTNHRKNWFRLAGKLQSNADMPVFLVQRIAAVCACVFRLCLLQEKSLTPQTLSTPLKVLLNIISTIITVHWTLDHLRRKIKRNYDIQNCLRPNRYSEVKT